MTYSGRALLALVSLCSAGWTTGLAHEDTVRLSATSLIMGGTNQVLSVPPATSEQIRSFVDRTYREWIAPTGFCGTGPADCDLLALYTPEQLWPLTGLTDMTLDESVAAGVANLDDCIRGRACTVTAAPYTETGKTTLTGNVFVVKGISQSAVISGKEKAGLIANPVDGKTVNFVITSSPNRPNGGIFERFAGFSIMGITFNGATPTDSSRTSPLTTIDVARQYDGWDDFPTNPLNPVSVANALLGALFLHAQAIEHDGPMQLQGYFQDTTYYLAPSTVLPLLVPLKAIPVIGTPLAKVFDAPLRVIVETGYNRAINPGEPTRAQLCYFPNPVKTLTDFALAIPTGWDDAISYVTGNPVNRPFHTRPQPVYGVGGPPVYAGAVDPYGPISPPATDRAAVESRFGKLSAAAVDRPRTAAASTPAPQAEPSGTGSPAPLLRRASGHQAPAAGASPWFRRNQAAPARGGR